MSSLADPPTPPTGAASARPTTGAGPSWPRAIQRLVAWVQDHTLPDAPPAPSRLTDAHLDRHHHRKEPTP